MFLKEGWSDVWAQPHILMKTTHTPCSILTIFALGVAFLNPTVAAPDASAEAAALKIKSAERQIAASKDRIKKLETTLKEVDGRIEKRVSKVVDTLKGLGDSKDSGVRVSNSKLNVIDFMRKQISDYSRRRSQLRTALDSRTTVIPAETIQSDIAKIDGRIDHRIAQVAALGGSFASHEDYDKYIASDGGWYGATEYRLNEDYVHNRKSTTKTNQAKGKLTSALDENIKRLESNNRLLRSRMAGQSAASVARIQADIARNEALIETLRGNRVAVLMPNPQQLRALGSKEAQSIADRLKETGAEIRRDQNTLTSTYNSLNAERAKLAPMVAAFAVMQKAAPAKP